MTNQLQRGSRGGFTLVEALLALSLSIVLMSATFSALHQYARLENRGTKQVSEARVALAVMRDLECDVQRIAAELIDRPAQAQGRVADANDQLVVDSFSTMASQFDQLNDSAFGEKHLQFESLDQQPIVFFGTETQLAITATGQNSRFQTRNAGQRNELSPKETIAWCIGNGKRLQLALQRERGNEVITEIPETVGRLGLLRLTCKDGKQGTGISCDVQEIAPKVNQLHFRYFDNSQWHDQWNSELAKALPDAIEVEFSVDDSPDRYRWVITVSDSDDGASS